MTVVNDQLYDELLRPITEMFYSSAKALDALPVGDGCNHERLWKLSRLTTLEEVGNLVADVINVPSPEWAAMRDLARAAS